MAFAESADLTMYYRAAGPPDAPRVVFLNSLGTDCRIWDDLILGLGGRIRSLRYDERGQGLTQSPDGPYTIIEHANDLAGLLDSLRWGPAILCGLSIGGMIAMAAAVRRPDLVQGLVLADTADLIGPREFWDTRISQVRADGLEPLAETVMERWFGSSYRREQPVAVRGWTALLARAPVNGYLGSCAALRDADLGGLLGNIRVPAVCICGSEDQSTPTSAVRRLAERLPDATYREIAGAGHLAPVERPDEFASILLRFLESDRV
jgi:3-oxoadipate enol-lactonase